MSQWQSPVQQGSVHPSPASGSGRRALIITVVVAVLALVIVATLALSGAFSSDAGDAGDPTPVASPETTPTPSTSPTPSPEPTPDEELPGVTFGTAEDPLAPGESFTMLDDWTITLGASDLDTWPDLEPHFLETRAHKIDQYQPDPGTVYVSTPATVTYAGDPADQDRISSIVVEYLAADGTVGTINTCGRYGLAVEPFNTIYDEPFIGTACTQLPATQAPGGQWRIFISWFTPEGQETYIDVFYATA